MEILEVLSLIYRGLSYALYPVLYVVLLLIQILHWLITPLIYISIFIKEIALLPVRFLAHFEVSPATLTAASTRTEMSRHYGISLVQLSLSAQSWA